MKTRHRYLVIFYWIVLLIDCYFIFSNQDEIRYFTKPLLMPLLLVFYLLNVTLKHHLPSKSLTIAALVLAWTGDIFLLGEGESNFMIGLVLFLLMHLVYVIYFLRVQRLFPVRNPMHVWLPFLLIAVYDAMLMSLLLKDSNARKLEIPLIIYMAVVSIMFVSACNVLGSKKAKNLAPRFFIPGAALFIISDSLLGLNKYFFEQEIIISCVVILTYGYAQLLLVNGFIKHVKERSDRRVKS